MAIEAYEVVAETSASRQAPSPEVSTVVAGPGHQIARAWVCPLVKTLCIDVSEAPNPKVCRDCAIHKTWHLADNVDPRFWY
jgi:hypothetical protein